MTHYLFRGILIALVMSGLIQAQTLNTLGIEAATYDSENQKLNIPSITVKNTQPEQNYHVKLQYNAEQSVFEFDSISLLNNESSSEESTFDPASGTADFSRVYLETQNAIESYQLALQQKTGASQFGVNKLTAQPYFPGISAIKIIDDNSVRLSWQATTLLTNKTSFSYKIYLSQQEGFTPDSSNLVATVNNQSEYTLTDLTAGNDYYVLIIVLDQSGQMSAEREYYQFNTNSSTYQTVIVGAGLSGLTAAYQLKDKSILVLEKENLAGGRVKSGQWNGFYYPKGTEYIGEPEGELKDLLDGLGLTAIAVPPPTDGIAYQGKIYSGANILNFLSSAEKVQFEWLDKQLQTLDSQTTNIIWDDQTIGNYQSLDKMTVKSWLDDNDIGATLQTFLDVENKGLFGAANDELSFLYNINEMVYNIPDPTEAAGNESSVYTFKKGIIEIIDALSNQLTGKITYGAEVNYLSQDSDGTFYITYIRNKVKHIVRAQTVILTPPAPITAKIAKDLLSVDTVKQLNKIPYGHYITINFFTDKRYLKDVWTISTPGEYFATVYDVMRYQVDSDYTGKSILGVYLPATNAADRSFIEQSDETLLNSTYAGLEKYFPGIQESVMGYDIQRFYYAFPVFIPDYYSILEGLRTMPSNQKGLFLAGDYMRYATVDGAIQSAVEAVEQVKEYLLAP